MTVESAAPIVCSSTSYCPVAWFTPRPSVSFVGDATSVAIDSHDHVYVFNRGPTPMIVLSQEGQVLDRWGEGEFDRPHGLVIDAEDNLYLVDVGGHFVDKRRSSGELLFRIGIRGAPAQPYSGGYFNRPTDVAVHPRTGDLYVSDGYGNARIHRFSSEGEHLSSWGSPGDRPGEFYLPHSLAFLDEDRLVVCDRENFRLQIFTLDGTFVDQWRAFRPCTIRRTQEDGLLVLGELGPNGSWHGQPNLGNRIVVLDRNGGTVTRFGAPTPGYEIDRFFAPHGLAVDSGGDVYVAEVARTWSGTLGLEMPAQEPVSLKRWRRTSS